MSLSIKAKVASGIGALFAVLLAVSIVAIVFINILSSKTEQLLSANYNSIRYCSELSEAMDDISTSPAAITKFETNLSAQENNITESGEKEATQQLRNHFEQVKAGHYDSTLLHLINNEIYAIYRINQKALTRKNTEALATARDARLWLSVLTTLLVLISFSLVLSFPGYIANPIRLLTAGIKEIAQKNYDKRIFLDSKDEFGEMASAFNIMARQLYEYEHSNLSKLLFEKRRVETIINQMEDAVIGLDAANKILFINHKAEGLFAIKESDVAARYAPDVALHNDLLRTILQQDPAAKPLKIMVNNKENYFSVSHRTVFSEDKNIGEVITLKNITTFKELDISKTNLLATISHELKTPISSIKMSTHLINDERTGALSADQKELINDIEEDANRLLRITGELLNMTQIESGNIQLKLQKADTAAIVTNALDAVTVQAEQKHITLETSLPPAPLFAIADADKTSWVLINLLTNAIKYSPDNSRVVIIIAIADNAVQFSVQDHGAGIEEKYLPRLFDRYFKVPNSLEKSGTGLGLSISKEFIDAQGGSLTVHSQLGIGSTFSFTLPLAVS